MGITGIAASSTVRQIAGSLGTAILMIVTLFSTSNDHAQLTALNNGYHTALIVAFIMAVLGLLLSFSLRKTKTKTEKRTY